MKSRTGQFAMLSLVEPGLVAAPLPAAQSTESTIDPRKRAPKRSALFHYRNSYGAVGACLAPAGRTGIPIQLLETICKFLDPTRLIRQVRESEANRGSS